MRRSNRRIAAAATAAAAAATALSPAPTASAIAIGGTTSRYFSGVRSSGPTFSRRGAPRPAATSTPPTPSEPPAKAAGSSPKKRPKKKRRTNNANADNGGGVSPETARTESFQPVWAGSLPREGLGNDDSSRSDIPDVHTIVLGTHPSIASLAATQYFGHPLNAYWWIAGDCLGFRRAEGVSPSTGKPYKLAENLRFGPDKIIPYEEQLRVFTGAGFALWDIVRSCVRPGSLDADITDEAPNPIREFCDGHPSVRRIVIANGTTGCAMFKKHFREWCLSGELRPRPGHAPSENAFKGFAKRTNNFAKASIEVVCALGVSPAAAKFTYDEKLASWEEHCYGPGLRDHAELAKDD